MAFLLVFQNYKIKDAGKVVVYVTSMSIVRETFFACLKVLQILKTHMVQHDVRDLFMSRELQTELKERIGCEHIEVPQLFIDGQLIGVSLIIWKLSQLFNDFSISFSSWMNSYFLWKWIVKSLTNLGCNFYKGGIKW